MKNINYAYLILPFFLALIAPVLNNCFHFVAFERANENRRFNDSLTISIHKLDNFPKDCEIYMNDNFAFRSPLIALYKKLKIDVYQVSPEPSRMIVGRNGRYFIGGDEKYIYEGGMSFTPDQLDVFEKEWIRRKKYFDSLGIAVYLMPAPTGLELYPEDLPFNVRKHSKVNRFEQLESRFAKQLPGILVNPLPVLKAGKKEANMYFYLDNHWTKKGGYLASKLVLERMKKDRFPELDLSFLDECIWVNVEKDFGLFVFIAAQEGMCEGIPEALFAQHAEKVPSLDLSFKSEGVDPTEYQYHFINKKAGNKLKLLVIRDSFGEAVYPFLKEAFAESVFIHDGWGYRLNKPVIEKYRPDVVLYITYDPLLKSYLEPGNWE